MFASGCERKGSSRLLTLDANCGQVTGQFTLANLGIILQNLENFIPYFIVWHDRRSTTELMKSCYTYMLGKARNNSTDLHPA